MFKIKMAGLVIEILNQHPYIRRQCKKYITKESPAAFSVSATEEELLAQQRKDQRKDQRTASLGYCESLCVYRNLCLQLPEYDGFLIHGAAIALDGEAYLFLAKSGVGKSTHLRKWKKAFGRKARVVNGDKPILRRFDGSWYVCGTPWQGKERWGENRIVPLKACCFLERAEENNIFPAPGEEVTRRLFHQLLMPTEEKQMLLFLDLVEDLLEKVPCYILQCNQETDAAFVAYRGMSRKEE